MAVAVSHSAGIPLVCVIVPRVPVLGRRINSPVFNVPVAFGGLNTGT